MGQGLYRRMAVHRRGACLGPRAIFNAVATMERERLVHLTLCPRIAASQVLEAMLLPILVLLTSFQIHFTQRAERGHSTAGVGGAFNLVAFEAYRSSGTHANIRSELNDEMALGKMTMRQESGRGLILSGQWGRSRQLTANNNELLNSAGIEVWMGCSRNFFFSALLGISLAAVPVTSGLALVFFLTDGQQDVPSWVGLGVVIYRAVVLLGLFEYAVCSLPVLDAPLMPFSASLLGLLCSGWRFSRRCSKKFPWHGHEYRSKDLVGS